ncbi:MAG: glycosyltransferase [Candidatus Binatia bacterium]
MKILVLTKRQYTGKDLLNDRFGRLREIPLGLAQLAHEVSGICLSYRPRVNGTTTDGDPSSNVHVIWHSLNLGKLIIPGLVNFFLQVNQLAREFRPDIIWACSDSFHAIFGVWLGNRLGTKCVLDLYDNFESFKITRLPGILPLFKRAVNAADGVTCASRRLAERVSRNYRRTGPTMVLENAARTDLFYARLQKTCRKSLGLPTNAQIIGTAGALYRERGINALFRGFELLAAKNVNLHLAIAGPRDFRSRIPTGPRVHDFGILPLETVPFLINALNVAVICNRDSPFGRYCFPQKAYEIMACRVPLVAAAVGMMEDLLEHHPQCLFEPDNAQSCANAIRNQLTKPTLLDFKVPSWSDTAKQLEAFLAQTLKQRHDPV